MKPGDWAIYTWTGCLVRVLTRDARLTTIRHMCTCMRESPARRITKANSFGRAHYFGTSEFDNTSIQTLLVKLNELGRPE